jgi:hypothetical protein
VDAIELLVQWGEICVCVYVLGRGGGWGGGLNVLVCVLIQKFVNILYKKEESFFFVNFFPA